MIILVYILIALAFLFLVLPALLPSRYKVEKSIQINRPASVVFENVANLGNYRDWNPWQKMEQDSKTDITGTPATPGHKFSWEGKKIGIGSLTLRRADPYKKVELDLQFIKPFRASANDDWTFEERNGVTRVIWKNEGDLPYPVGRLMGPMIRRNLDQQFVQGFRNLKEFSERS